MYERASTLQWLPPARFCRVQVRVSLGNFCSRTGISSPGRSLQEHYLPVLSQIPFLFSSLTFKEAACCGRNYAFCYLPDNVPNKRTRTMAFPGSLHSSGDTGPWEMQGRWWPSVGPGSPGCGHPCALGTHFVPGVSSQCHDPSYSLGALCSCPIPTQILNGSNNAFLQCVRELPGMWMGHRLSLKKFKNSSRGRTTRLSSSQ